MSNSKYSLVLVENNENKQEWAVADNKYFLC